jgi:hypothetical protein
MMSAAWLTPVVEGEALIIDQEAEPPSTILVLGTSAESVVPPVYIKPQALGTIVSEPEPFVCGDNWYANYIYQKESNCDTTAINKTSGACGIGQALPCSKLPCELGDYECQNDWFHNYALERYGSWANAYVFWLENYWW